MNIILKSTSEEIWKDIPGFNNKQASSFGNLRDTNYRGTGKIKSIKVRENYSGYLICSLGRVHRLVAAAFIPNDNPEVKTQINHKNEIKKDNTPENLEWVSAKCNSNYGTRNKRISSSNMGRKPTREWTQEERAAQSKRQLGSNNTFYGKHHTLESKTKISKTKLSHKKMKEECTAAMRMEAEEEGRLNANE